MQYEPYKGVELTDTGVPIALEIIRHHRLLERYLTDHLEYDWAEVHDEADRLEHHISSKFADRIAEQLGQPAVDPHGDPIPTADLDVSKAKDGESLADHQVDDSVQIVRVPDTDPDILRYLSKHGIHPGTVVDVVEIAPSEWSHLTQIAETIRLHYPKKSHVLYPPNLSHRVLTEKLESLLAHF